MAATELLQRFERRVAATPDGVLELPAPASIRK